MTTFFEKKNFPLESCWQNAQLDGHTFKTRGDIVQVRLTEKYCQSKDRHLMVLRQGYILRRSSHPPFLHVEGVVLFLYKRSWSRQLIICEIFVWKRCLIRLPQYITLGCVTFSWHFEVTQANDNLFRQTFLPWKRWHLPEKFQMSHLTWNVLYAS